MKRDEFGQIKPVGRERAYAETASPVELKRDSGNAEPEKGADEKGSGKPIGKEEVRNARQTLNRYLSSKQAYDRRFADNFKTYNMEYTKQTERDVYRDSDGTPHEAVITKRIGGQTLNVIMNKHADAMDNYPEPICLPRERDDEETADMLTEILPVVLERNGFEGTYSNCWTDKLVGGMACYAVQWDKSLYNGLGDVAIKRVDVLSLIWEPFKEDIQDSDNVFLITLFDPEALKELYPQLEDESADLINIEKYLTFDSEDKTNGKAAVVDWYYKRDGKLHYAQFCGETVLFSSENEPDKYPEGFYKHGKYPFVPDPCFRLRDTCAGFGFVDICRAPQEQLDGLKTDILTNIRVNSETRALVSDSAGVNLDDLRDLSKKFIKCDSMNLNDVMRPLETKDIAPGALSIFSALIDEIKETTGTNDASNGASAAGVTSGSAIAALQEAGGKISRDLTKRSYEVFRDICCMVIELMRQFYTLPRFFRIVGEDKQTKYVEMNSARLGTQEVRVEGSDRIFHRLPVFDIEVKAQRSSPFSVAASNQMMMDMFRMGLFEPQRSDAALVALEGMSFEGKDEIVRMIRDNGTMAQQMQKLSNQNQMLNAMLQNAAAQNAQLEGAGGGEQPLPTAQPRGAYISG